MGRLQRIENKLERAINGAFAKAFRAEVQPVEIASAVRRAMDDGATSLVKGRTFAPTQYLVELSDTDFARLTAYEEDLREELVAAAEEHAESQRYQLKSAFGLRFGKDASLETGVFRIVTEDQPRAARRGEVPGADQRRGHHRSDQNPSGQPSARAAAGAAGGQPSARSGTESETASGGSSERDEARSDQHRSTQRREPDGMAQRREPDSTAQRREPDSMAQRREPDDWWYDGTQEPAVDRGMPGGPARAVPGGLPSGSPGLPGAARGAASASASPYSTATGPPAACAATVEMRAPKRSFTHCRTNRFGASRRSVAASPPQESGAIHVTNCCGVNSWRNAARQASQAGLEAVADIVRSALGGSCRSILRIPACRVRVCVGAVGADRAGCGL